MRSGRKVTHADLGKILTILPEPLAQILLRKTSCPWARALIHHRQCELGKECDWESAISSFRMWKKRYLDRKTGRREGAKPLSWSSLKTSHTKITATRMEKKPNKLVVTMSNEETHVIFRQTNKQTNKKTETNSFMQTINVDNMRMKLSLGTEID